MQDAAKLRKLSKHLLYEFEMTERLGRRLLDYFANPRDWWSVRGKRPLRLTTTALKDRVGEEIAHLSYRRTLPPNRADGYSNPPFVPTHSLPPAPRS